MNQSFFRKKLFFVYTIIEFLLYNSCILCYFLFFFSNVTDSSQKTFLIVFVLNENSALR